MNINQIFKNNKQWVVHKLNENPNYFTELSEDHKPEILYIGCSDSRVSSEELMGAQPGDVFVMRNIANMVSSLDVSAMSIIKYAVSELKVKHVIVCGHYECGGVKAAMESNDLGILNPWLRNIRDVYRMHSEELNAITCQEEKYKRLVELNVREQCINVLKTSDVQLAINNRDFKVHGWVFDIHNGKLVDLKINFGEILEEIKQIYHLDN
ncbi:carbonic anhydrase [Lutibacter agarilyticus]|uniref:Carbonic anhydrase 2 n=1 Tax=Lutibacter agarilyticus TaxID=1109740 RepID=A0A238VEP4_9FLAO|nr:carbonic anhydrase [Lutibacter agarilyticus]SNR32143.1 carbonic anhydrase [Lutibacter agarilyticus]